MLPVMRIFFVSQVWSAKRAGHVLLTAGAAALTVLQETAVRTGCQTVVHPVPLTETPTPVRHKVNAVESGIVRMV